MTKHPSLHNLFSRPCKTIQNAISARGLQNKMRVTTAIDQSEILSKSYLPSQGQFRPEVKQFIDPIIRFLVNNNNIVPLLVNLHPYYSYVHNKADIPLELEPWRHVVKAGNIQDLNTLLFNVQIQLYKMEHLVIQMCLTLW